MTPESDRASLSEASKSLSAQHTPGPWGVYQWAATRQWLCMRQVMGSGGLCESLKNEDGSLALFATEALARAAIAKATGSTS